jgi:hypothetical protein
MAVDASIYSQIAQPRPVNRLAQYANVAQIQGLQQQNALAGMKMDEMRRASEDDQALRADLAAPGADPYNALLKRGRIKEANEFQKGQNDQAKTKAETAKIDFEMAIKKAEYGASVLSTAKDQATYDQARQVLAQTFGEQSVAKMPPQFDPSYVQAEAAKGMTYAQRLTDERARQQQAETARHNKVTEANSAGQLRVSQENLGVRRQELSLAQEKERRERGQDQTSGGSVLGVPAPSVLPWSNQSNPKDANKVKAKEQERGSKEIEKDTEEAGKQLGFARDAQRFLELSKKVKTGGLIDKTGVGQWLASTDPDYAEMQSITARLAPAQRQPGAGATSDFDAKQFERATVGVDKPKQTNENIAQAVIARAQQSQDYAEFRQTYLEQNGTLQGADRHWKEYVTKNPIFDPEKTGTFEPNKKRQSWRDHFKTKTEKPSATTAPAGGGLSEDERKELEALRAQFGRKGG